MGTIIVATIAIVGMVLILSLVALSKAYAYKHQVDAPTDEMDQTSQLMGSGPEKGER